MSSTLLDAHKQCDRCGMFVVGPCTTNEQYEKCPYGGLHNSPQQGQQVQYKECPACQGSGCIACNWLGQIVKA